MAASLLSLTFLLMPWLETTEMSIGEYSMTAITHQIIGISTLWGILAALIALAGGWLAWKRNRYAFLSGLLNSLIGLGFLAGWLGSDSPKTTALMEGLGETGASEIKTGLYLFISSALLFLIFSIFLFRKQKKQQG